jgi:hypothetical protein
METTKSGDRGYKQRGSQPKDDRGFFLQLPYILIDLMDMSDSAIVGFVRFCRRYLQKDYTATYQGSYRSLADTIKQARMTCYRSVDQWVYAGLVARTENGDDFTLTVDLSPLWENNPAYCKALQRPKNIHTRSSTASQRGTQEALQRPTSISTASQNCTNNGQNWDANEGKTSPIDSLQDSGKRDGEILSPGVPPNLTLTDQEIALIVRSRLPKDDAIFLECIGENSHRIYRKSGNPIEELMPFGMEMSKELQELLAVDVEESSEALQSNKIEEVKEVQTANKPRRNAGRGATKKPKVELSEAEQRIFEWYCGLWFIRDGIIPDITETTKTRCGQLVPHVHSFEEMDSLEKKTRAKIKSEKREGQKDRKVLYPGDLVNGVNEWKASRKIIDFQEKSTERLTWRERYENDPNNGGYNDEASLAAFLAAGEEAMNAAR